MSHNATAMLVLGAIGLVALVALALGLGGGSTTSATKSDRRTVQA